MKNEKFGDYMKVLLITFLPGTDSTEQTAPAPSRYGSY